MEDLCKSFRQVSLKPTFFVANEGSLEYTLQDSVLPILVPQVHFTDPWDWNQPAEEHPATFETLDNLRGTYTLWKDCVEGTAEGGP